MTRPLVGRGYGSAAALAAVLKALRLRPTDTSHPRRMQRFLGGIRPSEENIAEMIKALATDLGRADVLGVRLEPLHSHALAVLLMHVLALFDMTRSTAFDAKDDTLDALADDLGFRIAGWYLLRDEAIPSAPPAWVQGERDVFVKELFSRRNIDRKREIENRRLALGKRALDGLLAGSAPEADAPIISLADILEEDRDEIAAMRGRLRMHFAARSLYEALGRAIGRDRATSFATRAHVVAWWVHRIYSVAVRDPNLDLKNRGRTPFAELLCLGGAAPRQRWFVWYAAGIPDQAVRQRLEELGEASAFPWRVQSEAERFATGVERELGASLGTIEFRARSALGDERRHRVEKEADAARAAIDGGSEDPRDWLVVADALLDRGDEYAALALLERSPPVVRQSLEVRIRIATCLVGADAHVAAMEELDAVCDEAGDDARIHELRAVSEARRGHLGKARGHATRAAELGRPCIRDILDKRPELFGPEAEWRPPAVRKVG